MCRDARQEGCEFCGCGNAARLGYALTSLNPSFGSVICVSYPVRVGDAGKSEKFSLNSTCVVERYKGQKNIQSYPSSLLD